MQISPPTKAYHAGTQSRQKLLTNKFPPDEVSHTWGSVRVCRISMYLEPRSLISLSGIQRNLAREW